MRKEIEFECENKSQSESDKCIFHDNHFLDNEENRKIIQQEFQKKIDEYASKMDNNPVFCIGYYLYDTNILDKEFPNPVYFDEVNISGSLSINSKFLNHVSFTRARFLGGEVSFKGTEFSGEGGVSFNDAQFSCKGNVDFSDTQFSCKGNVDFVGAQFSGEGLVTFSDIQFSGEGNVDFTRASFSGEGGVSFMRALFSGDGNVKFVWAQFSGEGDVSFSDAQFLCKGKVDFVGAGFSKANVFFTRAQFSGEGNVDFGNVLFSGGSIDFNAAQFSGEGNVSFNAAQFSGEGNVSFGGVQFSCEGSIDFVAVNFSNLHVDFLSAQFSGKGDVDFVGVQFSGKGNVTFSYTQFSNKGDVDFSDAEFLCKGDVTFNAAQFSGEGDVTFNGAQFSCKGDVDFNNVKFSGLASFNSEFKTNIFFRSVNFMSPNLVRFETEDLSKVSFLNTDITRALFHENARFGKLGSETEQEEFRILDDRTFEECIDKDEIKTMSNLEIQQLSLGSILASYRNLRENYEYRLRYDEAGQFFIREMELKRKFREEFTTPERKYIPKENNWLRRNFSIGPRRKYKKKHSTTERKYIPKENNWLRRNFSFIGLYHNICNYGESSTRPLILFGIIIFLSITYWSISSTIGLPLQKALITSSCNEPIILCSLERTLSDIVGFPEKGIIADYITRISSIIVLATLFLPFRRKFERRFRH